MLVFYLATSMCGLSVNTVQCLVYRNGVVYKGLRRVGILEQWSLKPGGLLIQVVSNTGLTETFQDSLRKKQVKLRKSLS